MYVQLADGAIRNTYTINIRNMESRPRSVTLALEGLPAARMWTESGRRETAQAAIAVALAPDQVTKARVYVVAPAASNKRAGLAFIIAANDRAGGDREDSFFERPNDE